MKKKPTDHEILTALNEIIKESQKPKNVELALIDDLEKLLDKGLAEKRKNEKILRKAANDLREGTKFLADAKSIAQKALKSAKELGAKEAVTLFTVRLKEAEDFEDDMLKASNKVLDAIETL